MGFDYIRDHSDRFVDPLFCAPELSDWTLHQGSPCLPEDPLGCGLIGAFGQGCGPVSIEPETWARIKGRYRSSGGGGP